jgi:hypothetical protein
MATMDMTGYNKIVVDPMVKDILARQIPAGSPTRTLAPELVGAGGELTEEQKKVLMSLIESNQKNGGMAIPSGEFAQAPLSQELTPIQKSVLDGLTIGLKKSAQEAAMQAGPEIASNMLQSVGLDSTGTPIQQTQAEQHITQSTDEALQQQALDALNIKPKTTPFGVLKDILTLGTYSQAETASKRRAMLSDIKTAQEITGNEPLQKGEREEIEMAGITELSKELAKAGSVDALTPENAQKFSLLLEGSDATLKINDLIGKDITKTLLSQGVPQFLKSQEAKELESSIEQAVQAKTRIETGAALQPAELKNTAKRYMPRAGDSQETARKRLRELYTFFDRSINTADPTGTHRKRALGEQQSPELVNSAIEELKKRGVKF